MRYFEEIEKKIIRTLIDIDKRSSLNCLNNILQNQTVDFFNERISFHFSIHNDDNLIMNTYDDTAEVLLDELEKYINKNVLLIINLFEYLSDNNYIIHANGNFGTDFNMGNVIVNTIPTSIDIVSRNKVPDFIKWAREIFYTTSKLQTLVDNDFIEESEKKYQDQLRLANTQAKLALGGFIVTLIALVVSIISQVIQITDKEAKQVEIINKSFDVNNTNEIILRVDDMKIETINKFDNQQLNYLLKSIQDLNKSVNITCVNQKN